MAKISLAALSIPSSGRRGKRPDSLQAEAAHRARQAESLIALLQGALPALRQMAAGEFEGSEAQASAARDALSRAGAYLNAGSGANIASQCLAKLAAMRKS